MPSRPPASIRWLRHVPLRQATITRSRLATTLQGGTQLCGDFSPSFQARPNAAFPPRAVQTYAGICPEMEDSLLFRKATLHPASKKNTSNVLRTGNRFFQLLEHILDGDNVE